MSVAMRRATRDASPEARRMHVDPHDWPSAREKVAQFGVQCSMADSSSCLFRTSLFANTSSSGERSLSHGVATIMRPLAEELRLASSRKDHAQAAAKRVRVVLVEVLADVREHALKSAQTPHVPQKRGPPPQRRCCASAAATLEHVGARARPSRTVSCWNGCGAPTTNPHDGLRNNPQYGPHDEPPSRTHISNPKTARETARGVHSVFHSVFICFCSLILSLTIGGQVTMHTRIQIYVFFKTNIQTFTRLVSEPDGPVFTAGAS
jgi:hypothetical protein